MHLMYYLEADGKRVYTLKVRARAGGGGGGGWAWRPGRAHCTAPSRRRDSYPSASHGRRRRRPALANAPLAHGFACEQKVAPNGQPTVSAHPGMRARALATVRSAWGERGSHGAGPGASQ